MLHLYHGSPFIHMEARVSTERPATAFLHHVGLAKQETAGCRLQWFDPHGEPHTRDAVDFDGRVFETRLRSMAVDSGRGSLAISPFPHQFLYPLDFAENYGFNWAGRDYLDMVDGFGWGVRQPPRGDRRFVPWVNMPPGTQQKLGVLLVLSKRNGLENLRNVARYTRNDSFKRLPGYKTMTSHYHIEHSLDYMQKQREQQTDGIPEGLESPEFVDVFKQMGVDIVHLAEFHRGATPRLATKERLQQLNVMHQECRRLSTKSFLLLPGEEPNVHLGGHWISFFPRPVNWVLNRKPGQPFVEQIEPFGKVYHVGSADDVLKLLKLEKGLAWTAHPRIKSSTGYPDAYRNRSFYKSDRFLGAAWKAMPADYSRDTLGWRVLDLLDDMSNWGNRKYVLGEVDIFRVFKGYELFGTMNINYLELDAIPDYDDGWQPVLDVLSAGRFFVSTGEVLIPKCSFNGRKSGEQLADGTDLAQVTLKAKLEWTYPLAFMEIVSGDGKQTYRQRIDLSQSREFGTEELLVKTDLRKRRWARIEVWDIARNGAYTQPVWIGPRETAAVGSPAKKR